MERYEIRVAGHLDDRRCRSFEAIEVHRLPNGDTVLVVLVLDQAGLHGLITQVRDLGVELLELRRVGRRAPLLHEEEPTLTRLRTGLRGRR